MSVKHYAFHSRAQNPRKMFAREFAALGLQPGFRSDSLHGNPVPRNGIVVNSRPLDTLIESKLGNGFLSCFLRFTKALRWMELNAEIMGNELEHFSIGLSSAPSPNSGKKRLLPTGSPSRLKAHKAGMKTDFQSQPAKSKPMHKYGLIDLLTGNELIRKFETIDRWKDAMVTSPPAKAGKYPTPPNAAPFGPRIRFWKTIEKSAPAHSIVPLKKINPPNPLIRGLRVKR
jgi:hypothetical protein